MSQFEDYLQAAKSAITHLFSPLLALEFEHVIDEGEYDEETLVDDIEDEDDSNIVDGLHFINESQLKLFQTLIIQIFKHHNHDLTTFKLHILLTTILCVQGYPDIR